MKHIICKVLACVLNLAGIILAIIEKNPLICIAFSVSGLISYELAELIKNSQR